MLKNILEQTSNKTYLLSDSHQTELKSLPIVIALAKLDPQKFSRAIIIETEVSAIHPNTWSSALNQSLEHIPLWKENYEALIAGQAQQKDELEFILNRVKSELSLGSGIVFVSSITPLLLRHSITRVARFLVALSNLSGLTRLYIICHSDCHVQDEKTAVAFASFQDQVADVVISVLTNDNVKGANCLIKTTSKSGSKATVQKLTLSIGDNHNVEEINQSTKRKLVNPTNPISTGSGDPDKLMQTTFRLGLRISEQEAKSQVVLPFWNKAQQETGEASINYTPDEADDWDEEDPDEDLDF